MVSLLIKPTVNTHPIILTIQARRAASMRANGGGVNYKSKGGRALTAGERPEDLRADRAGIL